MIIPSTEILMTSFVILGGLLTLDWLIGGLALQRRYECAPPCSAIASDETGRMERAA